MTSRDLGLLVAMVAIGLGSIAVTPAGTYAGGMWPTCVAAALLLVTARVRWPEAATIVLLATVVALLVVGQEPVVAVGWALGVTAGALTMAELVTRRGTQRPRLRDSHDLGLFLGAVLAGSVVAGACTGLTGLLLGNDRAGVAALATVLAHFNGCAMLLPFFISVPRHPPTSSRTERTAQVVALAVVVGLIFGLLGDRPLLVFLVLPVLTWCALRNSMRVTMVQLTGFGAASAMLTLAGIGPFAGLDPSGRHLDVVLVALHLFVLACVVSCLPAAIAVAIQRDVSQAASSERDRLQSLVHSTRGIAIIGTDVSGMIDLFNPGAVQLLGYAPDEVMGRSTAMFHRPEEIRRLAVVLGVEPTHAAVARTLAEPEHAGIEVEFVTRSGERRVHSMTLSPVIDCDGVRTGYVSTAEDVTERVRAHQALTEALDAERRATDRLRQVDQVKDIFVSSVSHELRTPITSILGYLEILEDGGFGELSAAQANALGRVAGNSERLLALIDDLLLLGQVQDGVLQTKDRDLDLVAVVRAAADVVAPTCESAGKDFTLDVPCEPVAFTGDRAQLERAVINLLGNAVKFTDAGGRIDLTLRRVGEQLVVAVRDTGVGIPPEEQPQVFTRFFRSTLAYERAIQGSGLGLSITQAIAASHAGRVEFDSTPGVGSEFRLVLPLAVAVPAMRPAASGTPVA